MARPGVAALAAGVAVKVVHLRAVVLPAVVRDGNVQPRDEEARFLLRSWSWTSRTLQIELSVRSFCAMCVRILSRAALA